jgi:YfiH family protein
MKPQPAAGFAWVDTAAGPALVCRALEPYATHMFTTRQWALGSPTLDDHGRRTAWRELAEVMQRDEPHLARLHQVHGASVVVRKPGDTPVGDELPKADVIVATDPSLAVAVQTADCAPILLVDQESGTVAAAHAGWRGLAARVPATAVRALIAEGSGRPQTVVAAVGPCISAARYEVGEDVRARFADAGFSNDALLRWFPRVTRPRHWLFDGWESARAQLEEAGVPASQIHVAAMCTATFPDVFCSYRRDGALAGRMAAAIGGR